MSSNSTLISSNSTYLIINNVHGLIQSNDILIGNTSGGRIIANNIIRNGEEKDFNTFMNLYKYIGTLNSGSFEENEIIYQESLNTSNAILHSANIDGGTLTLQCSNQVGIFDINSSATIIGNTSSAEATITQKYGPEIIFGSGSVLFLENITPVIRSANTNETFQLIFEF